MLLRYPRIRVLQERAPEVRLCPGQIGGRGGGSHAERMRVDCDSQCFARCLQNGYSDSRVAQPLTALATYPKRPRVRHGRARLVRYRAAAEKDRPMPVEVAVQHRIEQGW